jgi:glucokinase
LGHDAVLIDAGIDDCRVTIMQRGRSGRPHYAHNFEILNAGFDGIAGVLDHFRTLIGEKRLPPVVAIAFGGPVRGRRDTFSNGKWTFSEQKLKERFGFEHVLVVNDVAALASSLPWLGQKDLAPISGNEATPGHGIGEGRYAMVYTNHGVGVGALTHTAHGYQVIDTEGGHAAFAPVTPLHEKILKRLEKSFGRVSYERIISNPGLVNLHRAVCEINDWPHAPMTPLEVVLYGRTDADPACRETLRVYYDVLGAFCGDVALNLCSEGGVYVTSDVVLETGGAIQKSAFRARFEEKGHFSDWVGAIPTFLVTNRSARLVGLARFVDEAIGARENNAIPASAVAKAFSDAMETVDQTVVIVDGELKIVSVSGARWSGSPTLDEILSPGADFPCALARLDEMGLLGLSRGGDNTGELIAKLKRGERFSADCQLFGGRVSQLQATPREAGGYVVVSSDVTELRRRTKDLEELARNLRKASSLAEAASRSKSQFLANMSHEIRTPLNGVLGMAEILSLTPLTSEQKDMLSTVSVSGNLLLTVINDVLDFSKIEAGKVRLAAEPFSLRSTIENAVAALAPQAALKGLELIVRLDPALGENVLGDQGRVVQILNNVVGNAIKFTDRGHVLLDLLAERSGERALVTMSVSDTGCGIPKDKLERVFEMFEQVDGSASRHHDGTGLGLAITRRLLGLMNGQIGVESILGSGTTFRMRFELTLDPAVSQLPAKAAGSVSGREILIVDDNPINRQILEELARSWDMVPASAPDGPAALALLSDSRADRFAIAILDYQMPEMHGIELAEKIRSIPVQAALPLILLSSVGQFGDLDKSAVQHFGSVLTKPARTAQLEQAVRVLAGPSRFESAALPDTSNSLPPSEPDLEPLADATRDQPETSFSANDDSDVIGEPEDGPPAKVRILVADDNAINRRVIEAMLANGGYDVHFAEDGDEAVEAYRKLSPDIVFMDVSMPKLDGYGATAQIRKIKESRGGHAVVIGLTAHAMADDRQICIAAGMDEYLAKPLTRAALSQMLANFAR